VQRSPEPLRSTLSCATTVARAEALRAGGIDKDSCANAEGTRFGIAAVMHAASTLSWSPTVRSASIGFIGGLTTYSSFNYETTRLMEEGATGEAVLNATSTILGRSWMASSSWSGS
jgi:fluoride ion exporter CrcB/FEX